MREIVQAQRAFQKDGKQNLAGVETADEETDGALAQAISESLHGADAQLQAAQEQGLLGTLRAGQFEQLMNGGQLTCSSSDNDTPRDANPTDAKQSNPLQQLLSHSKTPPLPLQVRGPVAESQNIEGKRRSRETVSGPAKTVSTLVLMPILVSFMSISLFCSGIEIVDTKIGIKTSIETVF